MNTKLESLIAEIGKKQIQRFIEKSAKHNAGTETDLASDNFNWNLDSLQYWRDEVEYHFEKWKATATTNSNGREPNAIIDLINVLTALYHKIELEKNEV